MITERWHLVIGVLFAPLVAPVLFLSAVYFLTGYTDQGPGHFEKLFHLTQGLTFESYIGSLLLGAPLILILKRYDKLTLLNWLTWAFALGVLAGLGFGVFIYWPNLSQALPLTALFGVAGGLVGVVTAAAFWLIARIRNTK